MFAFLLVVPLFLYVAVTHTRSKQPRDENEYSMIFRVGHGGFWSHLCQKANDLLGDKGSVELYVGMSGMKWTYENLDGWLNFRIKFQDSAMVLSSDFFDVPAQVQLALEESLEDCGFYLTSSGLHCD